MRRKRILSQKRPAAGGEARKRASFLSSKIASYDIKTLRGERHGLEENWLMRRPAAGGEARERASFYLRYYCMGRGDFGTAGRDYSYIF